jgi:predicted ATP-binding protein involved in virulence
LTTLHHAASDKQLKRLKRGTAKKDSESREERLLRIFKRALAETLPDELKNIVKNEDDIVIDAPKFDEGELKKSIVSIRTFPGLVPFSNLSLGYQTTMAWVLDLAWRLFSRYPKSRAPLEEPAVVLVDEIDLHLHPHWQLEIMRKLASVFKRTQFIATAHSPLMVQSMPNANFAIVQKDENEVFIVNEPERVKGWRVDQILNSEYFGVTNAWDPETEKLFDERNELMSKARPTAKQKARLKELEKKIAALPTATNSEDRKAMELIRKAAQLLEQEN